LATLRKRFGRRLKALRREKGFNQLYLATLASMSEDFLSEIERGKSAPSFETIEALASALETDVTALFTFSDEPIKPKKPAKTDRLSKRNPPAKKSRSQRRR
jgi:transcriptional regulator with XRE-family HTH domain